MKRFRLSDGINQRSRTRVLVAVVTLAAAAACASSARDEHRDTGGSAGPGTRDALDTQAPARGLIMRSVGTMHRPRAAHTATTLADGRVLIAGGMGGSGNEGATDDVELYRDGFRNSSPMREPRMSHTATRLADGRVLIAGGYGPGNRYLASTELFDPATNTFQAGPSMSVARAGHEAVLLTDGRVLLVGGVGEGWTFLSSAEIFDPSTNSVRPTGGMTVPRESHTASLLADGRVLIAGGHAGRSPSVTLYASTELFDPRADDGLGAFTSSAPLGIRRHKHDAVTLADGRVLVTGGSDERDNLGAYHSAELWSPANGGVPAHTTPTGDMRLARYKHARTSVLLRDGRVLIGGGASDAALYDPASGQFELIARDAGAPPMRGAFSAVALLPDGRMLITGGYGGGQSATADAWIVGASSP